MGQFLSTCATWIMRNRALLNQHRIIDDAATRGDIIANVISKSNVYINSTECLSALAVAQGPSMLRDLAAFHAKGSLARFFSPPSRVLKTKKQH